MRKARLASPIRTHRTDSGKEGVVVLVVEQRDQLSHEIQRVPAHMRRVCKRTREDRLRLQAATRLFRGQFRGCEARLLRVRSQGSTPSRSQLTLATGEMCIHRCLLVGRIERADIQLASYLRVR